MAPRMKAETSLAEGKIPQRADLGLLLRQGRLQQQRTRWLKRMGMSLKMFLLFPGLNASQDDRKSAPSFAQ